MIQILAILIQRPRNNNIWFPTGAKGKRAEKGITEFISKPLFQHQLKRERIDFELIKARDNKNNKTTHLVFQLAEKRLRKVDIK